MDRAAVDLVSKLFEHSPDMVATADAGGRFTSVNLAFAGLTGYRSGELVGEPVAKIVTPEHQPLLADQLRRRALGETRVYEIDVLTKAGERVPVEIAGTSVVEAGEFGGSIAIARDLRERRAVEEELRQAQKMEAVGRVARGIAHDFNNVLLVMRGFGELIERKLPDDHPARAHAEKIVAEAERAAALTRQLLTFSRPEGLAPEPLDLDETLVSMIESLRMLMGGNVELVFRPGGDGQRVLADRGALRQIVFNLVANARDAMPDGGMVTIETRRAGSFRLLRVSDTGVGMDEQTRERVFDPFFTTKDRGSGLGLAIVFSLVQQQGGHVHAESRRGDGAVFAVYLPEAGE